MIEVQNIVKRYGATVAVNRVSFKVSEGEIVGFLGPNGAGKSTTLKIITCYIVADSGQVSVNGMDALENSLEVRRLIGYLPENTPLYPDMQVAEFLEFVGKSRGLAAGERRDAIARVTEMTGVERMLRKNIGHLSKGYRQRVGLAQALLHDPPILIMDEPTSGLDPHQIIEIRELIRELGKTKLIILSSHILQEVSAISTRVLIIKDGKLVADASADRLAAEIEDRHAFRCRIDGPEGDVRGGLESMPDVRRVEVLGDHDGYGTFRLLVGKDAREVDLGAKLFRLAVDKGWTIATFGEEEQSLENVYLRLTETPELAKAAG